MVASTVCSSKGLIGTYPGPDVLIDDTVALDGVEVDIERVEGVRRDFLRMLARRMGSWRGDLQYNGCIAHCAASILCSIDV
jgi:hypothetical protein